MATCPFCIENVKIDVLDSNEHCYLAPTNDPVLINSVMIIPHRHVLTPFDLTLEEWEATFRMLHAAKRHLDQRAPAGYSIGWNVHEVAGQEIPHAHLHVTGRYADEPMAGKGIRHALKQPANARPKQQ